MIRAAKKTKPSGFVTMHKHKPTEILLATNNAGKLIELRGFLSDLPLRMRSLDDFANVAEVEETGATYAANAELNAAGYTRQTHLWALAEDSGLEVTALNGAPGVFSARYTEQQEPSNSAMKKYWARYMLRP